jgi:hypothetical protein
VWRAACAEFTAWTNVLWRHTPQEHSTGKAAGGWGGGCGLENHSLGWLCPWGLGAVVWDERLRAAGCGLCIDDIGQLFETHALWRHTLKNTAQVRLRGLG